MIKKLLPFLLISVAILWLFGRSALVKAELVPDIKIIELTTASSDSASDEFVELFVSVDGPVDLSMIEIQYKSATSDNWQTKAELSDQLAADSRVLIATEYLEAERTFAWSGGLAASGGHLRVVLVEDEVETELDKVGWGSALDPELVVAPKPDSNQSLKRLVDEDGWFVDEDNNSADFFISDLPSPLQRVFFEAEEAEEAVDETDDESNDETNEENSNSGGSSSDGKIPQTPTASYQPLHITELLADPAKPQTDAEDEFVELYNPNSAALNVEGYVVEAGSKFNYSFTLPSFMIGSKEYFALYSIDSNLTLSNSGGAARVLDPNGDIVYEVAAYSKAKAGNSWALLENGWNWVSNPTPGKANLEPQVVTAGSSNQSGSRKSPTDLSASRKKSAAFSSAPAAQTSDSDSTDERNVYQEPEPEEVNDLNASVLVGVGSLTVLYAGYEYRTDIANRIYQFRRYLQNRRQNRSEV